MENKEPYLLDRIPPQALDVERTVLGSCLMNNYAIGIVVEMLTEECFYMAANRHIFKAIKNMFNNNTPVDLMTLAEELKKMKVFQEVGEELYLGEISQAVCSDENIEYYCTILIEKSTRRRLIRIAGEITSTCFDNEGTQDKIIDFVESKIFEVSHDNDQLRNSVFSARDVVVSTINDMEIRHDKSNRYGYKTGLSDLDKIIGYFSNNEYIALAGRPSNGKTALMLTMTINMCLQGIRVGIISLEMTRQQLGYRINSVFSGVQVFKMMHGFTARHDIPKVQEAFSKISEMPFWIDDTPRTGIMKIRSTIRYMIRKYGCQIFFIDHLHMMDYKRINEYAELSEISGMIFKTKKEFDIPIILLCQLDKPDKRRKAGRPNSFELRGTGAIHQDAETIMFVHRPELYEESEEKKTELNGVAEIIVDKSRNGPLGIADVFFDKPTASFKDLSCQF